MSLSDLKMDIIINLMTKGLNNAGRAKQAIKGVGDATERSGKQAKNAKSAYDFLGLSIVKFAARIGSIYLIIHMVKAVGEQVYKLIDPAVQLEQQMAQVSRTTEITGFALKNLGNHIVMLSTEIPLAREELTKIATIAGQLGLKGSQTILQFTETVAKMGYTLDMSSEMAATGIARLDNIFKETDKKIITSASHFQHMGDTLNYLSNNSTATGEDLLDFGQRVGGIASLVGMTSEEVFGFGAALKDLGQKNEVAASAFIRFTSAMISKGSELGRAVGIMGDELTKYKNLLQTDMKSAMMMFLEYFGKMSAAEQEAVLRTEGLRLSGVRTGPVLEKMGAGIEIVAKNLRMASEDIQRFNSMQREFEKVTDTTLSSWQLFKNSVSGYLAITVDTSGLKKLLQDANKAVAAIDLLRVKSKELQGEVDFGALNEFNVEPLRQKLAALLSEMSGFADTSFMNVEELLNRLGKDALPTVNSELERLASEGKISREELNAFYSMNNQVKDGTVRVAHAIEYYKSKMVNLRQEAELNVAQNRDTLASMGLFGKTLTVLGIKADTTQKSIQLLGVTFKNLNIDQENALNSIQRFIDGLDTTGKLAEQNAIADLTDQLIVLEAAAIKAGVTITEEMHKEALAAITNFVKNKGKITKDGADKEKREQERLYESYQQLTYESIEYAILQYNKEWAEYQKLKDSEYGKLIDWAALDEALHKKHFDKINEMKMKEVLPPGTEEDWFSGFTTEADVEAERSRLLKYEEAHSASQEKITALHKAANDKIDKIRDDAAEREKNRLESLKDLNKSVLDQQMNDLDRKLKEGLITKEDYEKQKFEITKQYAILEINEEIMVLTEKMNKYGEDAAEYAKLIAWKKEELDYWVSANYKAADEAKKAWQDFFEGFASQLGGLMGGGSFNFSGIFSSVFGVIQKGLQQSLQEMIVKMKIAGNEAGASIAGGISSAIPIIGGFISGLIGAFGGMSEDFKKYVEKINQITNKLISAIDSYIGAEGGDMSEILGTFDRLLNEYSEALESGSWARMKEIGESINDIFDNIGSKIEELYYNAMRGDEDAQKELYNLYQLLQSLMEEYKGTPLEKLFSKFFSQYGSMFSEALAGYTAETDATNKKIQSGSEAYFDNIKQRKEKFFDKVDKSIDDHTVYVLAATKVIADSVVQSMQYLDKHVQATMESITESTVDYLDLLSGETIRAMALTVDSMIDTIDSVGQALIDSIPTRSSLSIMPPPGFGASYKPLGFGSGPPIDIGPETFGGPGSPSLGGGIADYLPPAKPSDLLRVGGSPSRGTGSSGSGSGGGGGVINISIGNNYGNDLGGIMGKGINDFLDEKGEIKFSLRGGQLINMSTADDLRGVT